jgi:hypothetical protein
MGASSASLPEVSKWLISLCKAIPPVLNDFWVAKLQEADVLTENSWVLSNSLSGE